jgi:hypothetical protein
MERGTGVGGEAGRQAVGHQPLVVRRRGSPSSCGQTLPGSRPRASSRRLSGPPNASVTPLSNQQSAPALTPHSRMPAS